MGVRKVILACEICKQVKSANQKTHVPMGRKPIPSYPFQLLSIDRVGPLPRSKQGNVVLIGALDVLSKFVFLKPARDGSGALVAKFLENDIFLRFGVPEVLISDNARAFMGKQVVLLFNKYGINHWKNAFYHPQANAAERYMKTIAAACRSSVLSAGGDHKKWDESIPEIQMALNSTNSDTTGRFPHSVLFGQEYVSSEGYFPQLSHPRTRLQLSKEELEDHFKTLRENLMIKLSEAEERNKSRYDLRARPVEFKMGEKVWARNRSLSDASQNFCNKLDVKYIHTWNSQGIDGEEYLLDKI